MTSLMTSLGLPVAAGRRFVTGVAVNMTGLQQASSAALNALGGIRRKMAVARHVESRDKYLVQCI